jgi:2'-5' RNA ligase
MTIAYSRRRSARVKIQPFSWKAREFQLIESWIGKTKYVELARWTLRDDESPYLEARPARSAI